MNGRERRRRTVAVGQRELDERAEVGLEVADVEAPLAGSEAARRRHRPPSRDQRAGWRRSAGSRRPCRRRVLERVEDRGRRRSAPRSPACSAPRRASASRPDPRLEEAAGSPPRLRDAVVARPPPAAPPRRRSPRRRRVSSNASIIRRTTSLWRVQADDRVAQRHDERLRCRRTTARRARRGRARAAAAGGCRSTAARARSNASSSSSSSLPVSRSVCISSAFRSKWFSIDALPGPVTKSTPSMPDARSAPRRRTARPACGRPAASPWAATSWRAAGACQAGDGDDGDVDAHRSDRPWARLSVEAAVLENGSNRLCRSGYFSPRGSVPRSSILGLFADLGGTRLGTSLVSGHGAHSSEGGRAPTPHA